MEEEEQIIHKQSLFLRMWRNVKLLFRGAINDTHTHTIEKPQEGKTTKHKTKISFGIREK